MAYFECLHELSLIVDLMYEGGIGTMNYSISNNAEYGEYTPGRDHRRGTRQRMKEVLHRIQTGEYAKESCSRTAPGAPTLLSRRRMTPSCRSRRWRAPARDDALDQAQPPGRYQQELAVTTNPSGLVFASGQA